MISNTTLIERKQRGQALLSGVRPPGLEPLRIAVLCSFNAEPIAPFLAEALGRRGLAAEVYIGPFGQIAQEILDPGSGLYRFEPDAVAVIPAAEDLLTPLFQRPGTLEAGEADRLVTGRLGDLADWLERLGQRRPAATILAVPFGTDRVPGPNVLDSRATARGQAALAAFVDGVRGLDAGTAHLVTVDWDWWARGPGWAALRDDRLWYLGRMRLNGPGLAHLAELIARHVAAVRRPARKVVAVDLDNTLWGGVVGEVGLGGITLGNEGLGLAFQDFQRALLRWHDTGILLAACSKNNPEDALSVLDEHPDCILRREHFAALRINWNDKAGNLRELAAELNLGLDSFVFLDDNPVERGWVAGALPEVLVPDLPADPVDRVAALAALAEADYIWRLGVTETDRSRTRSYRAIADRDRARVQAVDFDAFLGTLAMELDVAPLGPATLARAAQMCERTNQFNLTTRRHTAACLEVLLAGGRAEIFTLAARDRFEDSGVVGLGILTYEHDRAEIDTLLLSCRVLGRQIEDAFLAALADSARRRGAVVLVGRYTPTAKNRQAAGFYPDRGFKPVDEGTFTLSLDDPGQPMPRVPDQLTLRVHRGSDA